MKSPVAKRSVIVAGHKTSVSLEETFWDGLKEVTRVRKMTVSHLVNEIDANRHQGNLSSAIRLFVLSHFESRAAPSAISISEVTDNKPSSQHPTEFRRTVNSG
jgi:predicted DNA-binding ribbon-helix-helix protein